MLAGEASYDSLGGREQALVRGIWAERTTALRKGLNYEAEFVATWQSYSEASENGDLIVHPVVSKVRFSLTPQLWATSFTYTRS